MIYGYHRHDDAYTIVDGSTKGRVVRLLREEIGMTTARHGGLPSDPTSGAEPAPDSQITRREWMRHAAVAGTVVAAGAGLAACSAATPQSSGPESGATRASVPGTAPSAASGIAPPAAPATTSPAAPETAPAITGSDISPALVVGKVSTIPVGGGVVYPSHGVVITQPTAGTFRCFNSSCTHLGCTVNKVAAGLIQCPCHGARFSIDDGSVKAGPAPRPLTTEQFTIQNGVVVLD
jgi:Rieske Fe-S protein